jgi:NAD(P)-dependent dehydrogenase (short-subunit alcohol dehydrogenase family)
MNLDSKIALVTGSSKGLGKVIARELAKHCNIIREKKCLKDGNT